MRMTGMLCIFLLIATVATAAWIKDEITLTTKSVGTVTFSHANHFDAVGRDCPSCHNTIFNLDPKKNPDASMADMSKGKSCGACHNGKAAFSVEGDCITCHDGRDVKINSTVGNVLFSHEVHTGMYGCKDCHPGTFAARTDNKPVTMSQMNKGKSCGACHNGNDAFTVAENCASCHPTRDISFENDGGKAVFSHTVHTDMFGCSDCHPGTFIAAPGNKPATMEQMEKGKSCGACHNGNDAFTVAENCETCHQM
jgi:c(7)-type cytochrome triheme protein